DRNKHSCLDRRNIAAGFRLDAAPPEESVDAEDRAPSKPSGGDGKQSDANEVQPLGAVGKEIAGAQKARGECHDERKQDRHQSPKEHHHQALSIDETGAVFNEPPTSGIVDAGGRNPCSPAPEPDRALSLQPKGGRFLRSRGALLPAS